MLFRSGGFVLVYGVGAVIGPLISSFAMRFMGPQGMFVFAIVVVALLTLFIFWRMRIRQWAPVVEKEPYVLAPETPIAIGDLDPRAEVDEGYDQGPDVLEGADVDAPEGAFSFWLGRSGEDSVHSNTQERAEETENPSAEEPKKTDD